MMFEHLYNTNCYRPKAVVHADSHLPKAELQAVKVFDAPITGPLTTPKTAPHAAKHATAMVAHPA